MILHFSGWVFLKNSNMGRNNWFQFKQFRIVQEHSAMKVGTDGVLLGAWVDVSRAKSILDIGAGTGVVSVMLAQRTGAGTTITGLEIEKNAATEAAENARKSKWNNRILTQHISFQEFAETCSGQFDLIVSNPPFFSNSQKSKNDSLAMARHNHLLPLSDLVQCSAKLLAPNGKLAVILPVNQAREFIQICSAEKLFVQRLTEVRPDNLKAPHRYLMEFGRKRCVAEKETLCIHTDDGSDFTEHYKTVTRDFYLAF
jgi:tRNA1Val (adenine37-N6)-methyltransferase